MTARERQKRRRRLRSRRQAIALATLSAVLVLAVAIRAGHERTEDKPEQTSPTVSTVETASPTYINALPVVSEKISTTPPPAPEPVSRYADLEISEDDRYTLACLVYHEARGESFEGQVAVVEVVLNRMLSDYFPDTVEEVVFQKYGDVWQFSPAPYLYSAEPDKEQYLAVHTAIEEREHILSEDTVYFSTAPYNESVDMIIGNHYFCKIF